MSVRCRAGGDRAAAQRAVDEAIGVFPAVESACTRFDPSSPLMRANARPDQWHAVPSVLFEALREAHQAHQRTRGRFDPRVLRDLVGLGYDRTWPFESGDMVVSDRRVVARRSHGPWQPGFRGGPRPSVRLGGVPVDLGGIGKGLALRWAGDRLSEAGTPYLVVAGGDCTCAGEGPDGAGWRIGVEDPMGSDQPRAVLELRDQSCATSSVRVRRWRTGKHAAHHLVDPRTGLPGGKGLRAVTVVHRDPADAEVWSKTLFLAGRAGIEESARKHHIAALWVAADGSVGESPPMGQFVLWRRS